METFNTHRQSHSINIHRNSDWCYYTNMSAFVSWVIKQNAYFNVPSSFFFFFYIDNAHAWIHWTNSISLFTPFIYMWLTIMSKATYWANVYRLDVRRIEWYYVNRCLLFCLYSRSSNNWWLLSVGYIVVCVFILTYGYMFIFCDTSLFEKNMKFFFF
jgi:hypothetical protein